MITFIAVCFASISIGILLVGIACVKEAFTKTVTITERIEAGTAAVETRRATAGADLMADEVGRKFMQRIREKRRF